MKETRTKGTDRYSSSISSLNLKLEDPWRFLEKILINILKPIYKFNNYNKYFRANDFEKNDKIKTQFLVNFFSKYKDGNSSKKYLFLPRRRIVSSTDRKRLRKKFHQANAGNEKNRGFEASAERRHTPISRFRNYANQHFFPFLSRLLPVSLSSSPLPCHFTDTSLRFFLPRRKASAGRRIVAECSTRRCEKFFATAFLPPMNRSYLLEYRFTCVDFDP